MILSAHCQKSDSNERVGKVSGSRFRTVREGPNPIWNRSVYDGPQTLIRSGPPNWGDHGPNH